MNKSFIALAPAALHLLQEAIDASNGENLDRAGFKEVENCPLGQCTM
ncbi:hypothetical protein S1OALGB6SA_2313 [Olavius algarvensis spirochete endosymbiont]|nr:hypothetical protein [Olavius algarvensis spirochete endosymbiont]VDB01212.1 hypothetical protein S1OALGB6SA_2313 [Olavius algarvensis spirochete endosymbiont]